MTESPAAARVAHVAAEATIRSTPCGLAAAGRKSRPLEGGMALEETLHDCSLMSVATAVVLVDAPAG